ncbi:Putative uncharacterized protein TTHA1760 [hydrothermal vent metagenome]|uniref:Uncharacterized protein n=1 Tax=hydrothermal vent metagenome TaxID=652676 RepID=A0A3B0ZN40_9ZZZZ
MENFGSWSILTTNFLIVLYLALNGVTLAAVLHLVNGKWRFKIRHIAVSMSALFPLAFVLLILVLANGEHTFTWVAAAAHGGHGDAEHHLSGWLNYDFLVARQVIGFFIIAGIYTLFIKWQHESDIDSSYAAQRRFRNIALLIPFFYFVYGTMVAWDFEMTQDPLWHSASYGVYHFQSNFHMFLAFFTILLFFLNRAGCLEKEIEPKIFNYMAQFMLAMTILWTYFYFTQYLIMWYARLPMEMARFDAMMYNGFAPLWWTFLTLKFVIPLTVLVINPNRHNPPVIMAVACCILLGSWIERYTWIAGSVDPADYHMPMSSFVDIALTALIIGAGYCLVRFAMLRYGVIKRKTEVEVKVE